MGRAYARSRTTTTAGTHRQTDASHGVGWRRSPLATEQQLPITTTGSIDAVCLSEAAVAEGRDLLLETCFTNRE